MTIDKRSPCSNPLECKPHKKILRTVRTVQSDHFIPLDSKIVHQPIANALQIRKELFVRPCPIFVIEKGTVGLVDGMAFQAVVEQQLVVRLTVYDELLCLGRGIDQTAAFEIVSDVQFGVEVC